MKSLSAYSMKATKVATLLCLCSTVSLFPRGVIAQMPMAPPSRTQAQPGAAQTQDTQAQITQLQQQVVQLQAALKQSKATKNATQSAPMGGAKPAMGMGDDGGEMGGMAPGAAKPPMAPMKDEMGGMGGMDKMTPPAGRMKGGSAAPMPPPGCCGMSMGMPMAKGGMADDKMGNMPSGAATPMKAKPMAAPKMTEAPHLLHIGAKDFFLDHQQHLGITPDQKAQLESIKSDSANQKSTSQGQIDRAQQQLWQLTSADQPNNADIDSKVQEVAQLRGAEQVAFIHSVSAASNVLTPEQRMEAVKPMTSGKGSMSKMPKPAPSAPMKMQ